MRRSASARHSEIWAEGLKHKSFSQGVVSPIALRARSYCVAAAGKSQVR